MPRPCAGTFQGGLTRCAASRSRQEACSLWLPAALLPHGEARLRVTAPATTRPFLIGIEALPSLKGLGFTPREQEIAYARLLDGYSNEAIAKKLGIADQTVKDHWTNIYHKAGVRNYQEFVATVLVKS